MKAYKKLIKLLKDSHKNFTLFKVSVFLLFAFTLLDCGTKDKSDNEVFLSLIGKSKSAPPKFIGPSELQEFGPNSPVPINPPDEVLANNPPPLVGDVVPRDTTINGPNTPTEGPKPKLEVKIDDVDYSRAQNYNFQARAVNTNEDKVVTLKNVGNEDLIITSVEVTGALNQFQKISGFSSGTLIPDQTATFTIRFTPNGPGLRLGQLRIVSNDPRLNIGSQPVMANYTLQLRGSGTISPVATIVKPPIGVSRFQRIVIEFSHEMDRGTVCQAAIGTFGNHTYTHRGGGDQIRLRNLANNSLVEGRCTWTGFRQLTLQPYTMQPYNGLESLTKYRIELDDAKVHSSLSGITPDDKIGCAGLANNACNTNRRAEFETEPKFEANLSINNRVVRGPGEAGVVMNMGTLPNVFLTGSISEASAASSIRIKKVGVNPTIFHSWDGSSPVNLSTLSNLQLRPHQGSNGYYIEIESGGKTYIRNFGFNWGNPHHDPMNAPVLAGGRVNIGSGPFGVGQIKLFLEKFIRSTGTMTNGNFRLDNRSFDQFLKEPVATGNNHKRTTHCINYALNEINHIRNYGDADPPINGIYGDGYCGGPGENPGAFQASGCGTTFDIDAYVTDIRIPKTVLSSQWNIGVDLTTKLDSNGGLEIDLTGRRLEVDLDIVARNRGLCLLIVGGGNRFLFRTTAILNFDFPSTLPSRLTRAKTVLTVDPNGKARIQVRTPYGQSNINDNFFIQQWIDAIEVVNSNGQKNRVDFIHGTNWITNVFSGITESIANGMVPTLKPLLVRGILRDIMEKVAPDTLNALFTQLRIEPHPSNNNGIGVRLPHYLPNPFNRTKLFIGANLRQNTTHRTGADGIDLGADIGILACVNPNPSVDTCLPTTLPASLRRPSLHTGSGFVDSFILSGGTTDADLPISQLASSAVNGNKGTNLIASHPGVLLAVRMDVINQTLYNLWRKGVFELSLDQNFANQVKNYRGDSDRLFQIFQILLKAENILRVLAPGQSQVFYGPNPTDVINGNDDIIFQLKPYTPPNIRPAEISYSKEVTPGRRYSLAVIEWNDLFIEVLGRRPDNSTYKITTLRINFRSRAAMNIHKFSSPVNGGVNNYQNVTSIQLNVCDDNTDNPSTFDCDLLRTTNTINDDLVYTMEVMDNPIDNPLGLDPRGIHEVLDPSVKKLILPVVNFVLEELPLEEKAFHLPTASPSLPNQPGTREDPNHPDNKIMANCGIRLENMSVLPIPATTDPYILIHTQLQDYTFSGNCRL